MNNIRQLDSITINKIAAGEVIDRPASIIKELIENSLDANASHITIEIRDGGKQYIRITDNGDGIHKDDLPLAPIRHTTSKIKHIDDIYCLDSFGFRGEALSSICHCSDLTIISKQDTDHAYKINAHQDSISELSVATHNKGTTIEVKDLFYNIPVRQQFLKSASTELSYIHDIITHFSLINPLVDFIFINNNKEIINTTGIKDMSDLILLFYGKELKGKCAKVNFSIGSVTIQGYVSDPTITFSNRNKQVLAINHRLIKNGLILKSIQDSFKDLIPQRRFPLVVFNIFIEQQTVDVNIHPQKLDIKFLSPGFIYDVIPKAINLALQEKTTHTDVLSEFVASPPSISNSTVHKQFFSAPLETTVQSSPSYKESSPKVQQTAFTYPEVFKKDSISSDELEKSFALYSKSNVAQSTLDTHKPPHQVVEFFQLFKTYIVIKSSMGLYIMDQHAVHERILYEKIKDDFAKQSARQVLLMSDIIDLGIELYPIFESNQNTFLDLNFVIEPFGGNQISIREVPVAFSGASNKDLIIDILEQFKQFPDSTRNLTLDKKETLQRQACRAAIKAGQTLAEPEVKKLIDDFIASPQNYTCPHGRPLFIHYDKNKLETLFLRK